MKSSNAILKHKAMLSDVWKLFGDVLVKHAVDLYCVERPGFFPLLTRATIKSDSAHQRLTQVSDELSKRVAAHDKDKFDIARYVESIPESSPSRLSRIQGAEARYRAHDLCRDHHASAWIVRPNSLHCVSFIEHLLDHAAFNLERQRPPFDIAFLKELGAFYAKRVVCDGASYTDPELYFNMSSFVIKHLFEKVTQTYKILVLAFEDVLCMLNSSYTGKKTSLWQDDNKKF